MHVRLTGAHNAESADTRLAGVVIDGRIALDAGSLTRSLSIEELRALRHVFGTHRHYDHIRDLPALAYATPLARTLHIYGLQDALDTLAAHLMNNIVYSAYQERTAADGTPRAQFHPLELNAPIRVGDVTVTPHAANHTAPAVGFFVSGNSASVYYTGDTGPGFSERLASAPPDLLIAEVTYSNVEADDAIRNGHMTPTMLRDEIERVVAASGWIPRVVVVHRNPAHEQQIAQEIAALIDDTGWDIFLGQADMAITI